MKVYLLRMSSGSYDDYRSWIDSVYKTRELAEEAKQRIMHELNMDGHLNITDEDLNAVYDIQYEFGFAASDEEERAMVEKYLPHIDYDEYLEYDRLQMNDDMYEPDIIEMDVIEC